MLVVGCCYSEASVSADVTAAFEEHLHFPLPTASQRRTVLESAWQRHARVASRDRPAEGQGEGGAESTAPPPALHALADSLAGLPLVPLLVRAREAVDSLARNSSTAAVTAANAASGAFGGVAGQERAKRALTECVLWPRRYPELFRSFLAPGLCAAGGVGSGQAGAGGVLLFGPPGNRNSASRPTPISVPFAVDATNGHHLCRNGQDVAAPCARRRTKVLSGSCAPERPRAGRGWQQ